MVMKTPLSVLCLFLVTVGAVRAAEPKPKGEISLSIAADRIQPAGWPIIVELTVTNIGEEQISWWCGGPDKYPGAEHFIVEVRYGGEATWHEVSASNGQYRQGSGFSLRLAPGESIVVPLAAPIELPNPDSWLAERGGPMGGVTIRVSPRHWRADVPVERYVKIYNRQEYLDLRRVRVINAVLKGAPFFWRHVGERYPDPVVMDAMLKLVTVDCVPIARGAARVLARQPTLPEKAAGDLALMVRRWVPRSPSPGWGGLRESMVAVALKTQSEPPRETVLELVRKSTDARTRWMLINALRLSPGDSKWLTRARAAILALQRASPDDQELAEQTKRATRWLDSRLENDE